MPWKPSEEGERPTLGWTVLDWIEDHLIVPDGPSQGEPLTFTQEQALFVLQLYEVDPEFEGPPIRGRSLINARLVRRAVLSRPKGWGKPLSLETPIPTPAGWTTMGEIRTGDVVFGRHGQQVRVIGVGDVLLGEPTYRLDFSDHSSLVAGAGHEWVVEDLRRDSAERIVTTAEIASEVVTPWRSKAKRWRIGLAGPLECDEVDLGIDPWLLGFWLGDGERDSPRLTVGAQDLAAVTSILDDKGIPWWEQQCGGNPHRLMLGARGRRGAPNLVTAALRSLGIFTTKAMPAAALRGSADQRWELLRGLVDSDGYVARGNVEVVSVSEDLAAGIRELMLSLGLRARMYTDRAQLNGRDCGPRYRVIAPIPPGTWIARLPRKQAALDDHHDRPRKVRTGRGIQGALGRYRHVAAAEAVPSVPMRCITVEGGIFLAGPSMIPTHNSPIVASLCIVEALGPVVLDGWDADGQPVGREWCSLGFKPKVQVVAASEDQTTNTWDPLLEMCRNGPVYDAYDIEPMETFVNVPRGMIEPVTSSGTSREGFRPVFSALDQTESWNRSNGGHKLAAAVRRNLGKMQGCSVETPNAPRPGMDTVAERSFAAWDLQEQGRLKRSTGMLVDHREAPPNTDPADEQSLRAGLRVAYGESLDTNGGWVSEDRLVSEFYDPDTDPADARAYYLNQITGATGSWVTKQDWLLSLDESLHLADGDTIALGFDGSKSDDATGLVASRMNDGAVFVIDEWRKPEGEAGRGWEVDRTDVDLVMQATMDRYDVVALLADVREFESYVDAWGNAYGERLLIDATTGKYAHPTAFDMRANVPEFTRAAARARVDIEAGEMPHNGDGRLQWHVLNCVEAPNKWGVSVAKRGVRDDGPSRDSPNKIDLAVCMIIARHARRLVLASEKWRNRGKRKRKSGGRVSGLN